MAFAYGASIVPAIGVYHFVDVEWLGRSRVRKRDVEGVFMDCWSIRSPLDAWQDCAFCHFQGERKKCCRPVASNWITQNFYLMGVRDRRRAFAPAEEVPVG